MRIPFSPSSAVSLERSPICFVFTFDASILSASRSISMFASAVLCACSVAPCATLPIASVTCSAISFVFADTSVTDFAMPKISSEFASTSFINPEMLSIIVLKLCSSSPNSSSRFTSSFVERSPFAMRSVADCSFLSSRDTEYETNNATSTDKINASTTQIMVVTVIARKLDASSSSPIIPTRYHPVMESCKTVTTYFSPPILQVMLANGLTSASGFSASCACA